MQDIKPAHHITHTKLADGTSIHINGKLKKKHFYSS
jgi:hypothetical protein